MEIRSLVSQAWESLRLVKELIGSGVSGVVQEAALRWYLYSLHQSVPDALASLPSEAGLRKPGAPLSGTTPPSASLMITATRSGYW